MKFIFNKSLFIDILFGISGGILIFSKTYTRTDNFSLSLLVGFGTFTLVIILLSLLKRVGKNQQKKVLDNKRLKAIKDHFQLTIETRNESKYWGYKGYYKGYFIRLTYDWYADNVNILIYFKQQKNENGEINKTLLDSLYKKHGKFGTIRRIFDTSHIRMFVSGIYIWKPKKIISAIEDSVDLLIKYNLKNIKENEVEYLIENDKYMHSPWVETFR